MYISHRFGETTKRSISRVLGRWPGTRARLQSLYDESGDVLGFLPRIPLPSDEELFDSARIVGTFPDREYQTAEVQFVEKFLSGNPLRCAMFQVYPIRDLTQLGRGRDEELIIVPAGAGKCEVWNVVDRHHRIASAIQDSMARTGLPNQVGMLIELPEGFVRNRPIHYADEAFVIAALAKISWIAVRGFDSEVWLFCRSQERTVTNPRGGYSPASLP